MNRKIGFHGGHSLFELGSASEMISFFRCLEKIVDSFELDMGWALLGDRLYRRYLKLEELDPAQALMDKAELAFAVMDENTKINNLNPSNLNVNFYNYFDSFRKARLSAISFNDNFGVYKPVRIVRSSLPEFMIDKMRSLEDYDSLSISDIPFWAREASVL